MDKWIKMVIFFLSKMALTSSSKLFFPHKNRSLIQKPIITLCKGCVNLRFQSLGMTWKWLFIKH